MCLVYLFFFWLFNVCGFDYGLYRREVIGSLFSFIFCVSIPFFCVYTIFFFGFAVAVAVSVVVVAVVLHHSFAYFADFLCFGSFALSLSPSLRFSLEMCTKKFVSLS